MKATDPNLLLEIQDDRIVITLPGTKFRVVYRKREHASWSWLIASDYDRDDSEDPVSRADFLARTWRLAHDKARELGWIGTSFIPRKSEMREDERELFEQMVSLVQGRDISLASNATMNLLANLIITVTRTGCTWRPICRPKPRGNRPGDVAGPGAASSGFVIK
jgi:hypothetical protein